VLAYVPVDISLITILLSPQASDKRRDHVNRSLHAHRGHVLVACVTTREAHHLLGIRPHAQFEAKRIARGSGFIASRSRRERAALALAVPRAHDAVAVFVSPDGYDFFLRLVGYSQKPACVVHRPTLNDYTDTSICSIYLEVSVMLGGGC